MEHTSARLSSATKLTALLLAPPLKQTAVARVEVMPLEGDRALAVVVTESGWVTARSITLDPPRSGGRDPQHQPRTDAPLPRADGPGDRRYGDDPGRSARRAAHAGTGSHRADRVHAARTDALRERRHQHAGPAGVLGSRLNPPAAGFLRAEGAPGRSHDLVRGGRGAAGHHRRGKPRGRNARVHHDHVRLLVPEPGARHSRRGGTPTPALSRVISIVEETARQVTDELARVRQDLYLPS